MVKIMKAMILLNLIGGLIFVSFSSTSADVTQTIVIKELKFDKPMPVKSGDTVKFIVRLENPSSIDSANFSVVLYVFTKADGTGGLFSLREQYAHLNAHNTRNIMLVTPFTIPMDYKNLYIWVAIDKFPGEEWPRDQKTDQKTYQMSGEKLAVTGSHTSYQYKRILPYPMKINIDILRIPKEPIK